MAGSDLEAPVRILPLSDRRFRADTAWGSEPALRHLAAFVEEAEADSIPSRGNCRGMA